jgi:hypothetical protein
MGTTFPFGRSLSGKKGFLPNPAGFKHDANQFQLQGNDMPAARACQVSLSLCHSEMEAEAKTDPDPKGLDGGDGSPPNSDKIGLIQEASPHLPGFSHIPRSI